MKRKRVRLAATAVLLAGVALILWAVSGRAAVDDEDFAEARREDLVIGVEVTGTLGAVQSVQLGPPPVPGMWEYKISFMAPEGMEVRAGQPVLGFDSSELERTLLEKMAEKDAAETELQKQRADLESQQGKQKLELAEAEAQQRRASLKVDVPDELVSRNELRESRADLDLAERKITYLRKRMTLEGQEAAAQIAALQKKRDRAAARVQETQAAIQRMTVPAPRDGTVVYVANRGQEKKKVGDSCWVAEKVIEIPDLRRMRAEGQVDEADAGRLEVGQRVTLTLDAHPDVVFTGRVRSIRSAVRRKSNANPLKVVGLELELDRTDPQRMRPGMRFLGTVEIERAPRALVVPAEAVFNRPDGPVIYRPGRWGVEEVRPRLGRRNERLVEVVSGLSEGDRILRQPPEGGTS
jgi:HlyD family secretion protein